MGTTRVSAPKNCFGGQYVCWLVERDRFLGRGGDLAGFIKATTILLHLQWGQRDDILTLGLLPLN